MACRWIQARRALQLGLRGDDLADLVLEWAFADQVPVVWLTQHLDAESLERGDTRYRLTLIASADPRGLALLGWIGASDCSRERLRREDVAETHASLHSSLQDPRLCQLPSDCASIPLLSWRRALIPFSDPVRIPVVAGTEADKATRWFADQLRPWSRLWLGRPLTLASPSDELPGSVSPELIGWRTSE